MKTSLFSEKSFLIEEKRKNAVKARESGKAIKEISAWKEISVSENKAEKEPHKRASLESLFVFINSLYQIEKLLSLLSAILLFFALLAFTIISCQNETSSKDDDSVLSSIAISTFPIFLLQIQVVIFIISEILIKLIMMPRMIILMLERPLLVLMKKLVMN